MDPALARHLSHGEIVISHHRPQLRYFIYREIPLLLGTLIVGPSIGFYAGWLGLLIVPALLVLYLFAFDDLVDWRVNRCRSWVITDRRILQIDTEDDSYTFDIQHDDLRTARRWFWWKVHVTRRDMTLMTVGYVPGVKAIAAKLRALAQQAEERP